MEESEKKFLSPDVLSTLLSRGLLSHKTTLLILLGVILIGFGAFYFKSGGSTSGTKVEVLGEVSESDKTSFITVDISGSVEKPGVYKLPSDSRIEDVIIAAGGISSNADRVYLDKYLNRASKITDGQKVYIPSTGEQTKGVTANKTGGDQTISSSFSSDSNGFININTASLDELDRLPGIGPVYGQSIIDHRPYSFASELVSKGAIKQNVFEKIKDQITTY